ncbi:MAG: metallophosphoesterase [Nitrospinae bacterium]|nr:metallophosphoesterase [Nitrospinota bacterium]
MNLRFAHCGDFHLGYDFGYLPPQKAAARQADLRVAFFRTVRETLKWDAQVFLISGDLFDTPYPSDRDVEIVSKNLSHLSKKGVRCFAIPGNHDPMHPKSVWSRSEIARYAHLFHGDLAAELAQENIDALNLTIAGIPWDSKDAFRPPLEEILTRKLHLSDRSILLFHGSEAALASEHPAFREHPFEADDLKRLPFGYVAIGHYHKPMDVARWSGGAACYSGSPEGLRFSDHNLGERSIVLGELDERGHLVRLERKPINARIMKTLSYSAGDGTTADDWFRAIDDMRDPDTLLRVRVPKQNGTQQRRAEVLLSALCSDFFYLDIVWESPS